MKSLTDGIRNTLYDDLRLQYTKQVKENIKINTSKNKENVSKIIVAVILF